MKNFLDFKGYNSNNIKFFDDFDINIKFFDDFGKNLSNSMSTPNVFMIRQETMKSEGGGP